MLSRFASKTLLQSMAARRVGVAAFSTHHETPAPAKFNFEVPDDEKTKRMYKDVIAYQLRNASPEVQQEALDVITESKSNPRAFLICCIILSYLYFYFSFDLFILLCILFLFSLLFSS